jgi:hypothetical protein
VLNPEDEVPGTLLPHFAERATPYPWWGESTTGTRPAPKQALSGPSWEVLDQAADGETRRIRARASSPRGAPPLELFLPPDLPPEAQLVSAVIGDTPVPPLNARILRSYSGWQRLGTLTLPPEGAVFELVLKGSGPIEAYLTDTSYSVPPEAGEFQRERSRVALPFHDGDVTTVQRRLKL